MPRYPKVAASTLGLSDSIYSRLAAEAASLSRPVYPLQVGDTYLEPYSGARAEAQRCDETPRLHGYAPVQGLPVLREAALEKLAAQCSAAGQPPVAPADLQIMSGATVGLSVVCQTLLSPGDELLLPSPYWPLIRGIVSSRGARPVELPFWDRLAAPHAGESAPAADQSLLAALEAKITPRTVAIYLNSPNNPTGRLLPPALIEAIAALAAEHDLWVICDEAYEDLIYLANPPPPLWTHPKLRERAIVCHTCSKSYGLAGARVGYTHGPHALMKAIRGVQTYQVYCAAKPMQQAAARAISEGGEWLVQARRAYALAAKQVSDRLGLAMPEGSTFFFFDAAPYFKEGEDLLTFLGRVLRESGVLLTPGGASGADYATYVRLCFTSVHPDQLEQALVGLVPLLA